MTKDKLPYSVRRWVKRHAFPILCNVNGTLLNTLEMMYSSGTLPEDVKSWCRTTIPYSIDPDKMNLLAKAIQDYATECATA
jgi:hypothetical protein